MIKSIRSFLLVLSLLQLGLVLPAAAAGRQCEAVPACQKLLEQGIREFKQERYEPARNAFEKAHAQVPDPRLLVFIGRTHFKEQRAKEALDFYKLAQPSVSDEADAERLQQYIAEARAALAAGEGAARPGGSSALVAATPSAETKGGLKPWMWAAIGVGAGVVLVTVLGVSLYYGTSTPKPDAVVKFP